MTLQDIKAFLRYIVKGAAEELMGFIRDIVTLRPKTVVYISGPIFVLAWITQHYVISVVFMTIFLISLIYKYWIAGDWRREVKKI